VVKLPPLKKPKEYLSKLLTYADNYCTIKHRPKENLKRKKMKREVAQAVKQILTEVYPDETRLWIEPYGVELDQFYVHAEFNEQEIVITDIEDMSREIIGFAGQKPLNLGFLEL